VTSPAHENHESTTHTKAGWRQTVRALSYFRGFRGLAVAATLCCSACGAPLLKLPSGPGAPATDAPAALADATAACVAVSTMSADIAASGTVDGQRTRGHLLTGLAAPASARLEAVAPVGQPLFIFVARNDDATLLLPRENRVLEHGPPAALLEAVTGVPADPVELRETLTGCTQSARAPSGRSLGPDWRIVPVGSTDVYLHRDPTLARWQLVAAVHRSPSGEWRAEYRDFQAGLPRAIHLASADQKRFNLTLVLGQVALNEPLGPEVFRVEIPPSAERITLDDLRHARPGVREN
jgi:hypothetical protein